MEIFWKLEVVAAVVFAVCIFPNASFFNEEANTNTGPIRVAAFNIKHFGTGYMKDNVTVPLTIAILDRYDIVLVQEPRDKCHFALRDLNQRLSEASGQPWDYVSSERLGRTSYKEQYVFFYKLLSVRHMGSHQVPDAERDVYEREPFAVDFEFKSVSKNVAQRIVLIALHAKPDKVKDELAQLNVTIRDVAESSPKADGVLAMGDFNAGCTYLSLKEEKTLDLFTSDEFKFLIKNDADTNVNGKTACAYDRIVLYNKGNRLDIRGAAVFDFEQELGLNKSDAMEISDHFPVEFTLH